VSRLVVTGTNTGDVHVRTNKLDEFIVKIGMNLKCGGWGKGVVAAY
jgi:hypothetical protein